MLLQSEGEEHHMAPPHLGQGLQAVDPLLVSLANITMAVPPAPLETKYEPEGRLDLSPPPPVMSLDVEADVELDDGSLGEIAFPQLMFTEESQTASCEELSSMILIDFLQQHWYTVP